MSEPQNSRLKDKALAGFAWSFLGSFLHYGLTFLIGIILARLLGPAEFGLIGMTTVFITICEVFINSGFSQALIRKQDCTEADYQTVFAFNLISAFLLFLILFFVSGFIANFFSEPKLKEILRILGLSLIIGALSIVQKARLSKAINFRALTIVNLVSNISSGAIAIGMAYNGFGVWSLVVKIISKDLICSVTLAIVSAWKPNLQFNKESFAEMFRFGSKLLLSGFMNTIFNNFQYLIIGKFFSTKELGFFSRAEQFKNMPSQNLESVITSVAYPLLAKFQNDKVKLSATFILLFRSTFFIVSMAMFALAACSEPIILLLLGEKWSGSIEYLQLLCAVGIMYPILSININLVNVMGRSDIYFRKQLIVQLVTLPIVAAFSFFGLNSMIVGLIISTFFAFFVFASASTLFIDYSFKQQVKDILPISILMAIVWGGVYVMRTWVSFDNLGMLLFQLSLGGVILILVSEVTKQREYIYLKNLLFYYFQNTFCR